MGLKKRVKNLEEKLEKALLRIEEQEERILGQEKIIEELKRELSKYRNPNTPPSSNKHLKPDTFGKKAKKNAKRGAPLGHIGTNDNFEPENYEDIDADECPNCHGKHIRDKKILKRKNRNIEAPQKIIEEGALIHLKHCDDCNLDFIPPQNTTPLQGNFGISLMIHVIFIKFLLRGVLRKTALYLEANHAFEITPAALNEIIRRVAEAADKEYSEIKERIRKAAKIYVDETSFSVLGKNQWLWAFRTENDVLYIIRPSRGNNVLEEILGRGYRGIVICDCWRAYNFLEFALLQRCWAHLLRKSKELLSVAGMHLHKRLTELFEEIKKYNLSSHTPEERLIKYTEMTSQLKEIIDYYSKYPELEKIVKYIKFNLENWFTCIKVEGVEPTNNFAEQAIREPVMVRKIIGAFRSETGKENYETLASLIASWQLKGLDLKNELKQMLINNLCFC
jgi:hypothetical protein